MISKSIRTGVYWLLKFDDKLVVIKKWRWPFKWLYDLPWWKIEHWECNITWLKREIVEEIWLKENQFEVERLLTVEEDFVKHTWKWEDKDEHIIWIVYIVNIIKNSIDMDYIENWWDADWFRLIEINDKSLPKTNILKKAIDKYTAI